MTSLSPSPYKGTRDYYPEDKFVQNYIFSVWRDVVEQFGYQEYGTPILEPLDVYAAKSGQELVNDQTYVFSDRGGRTVAIRPEMTPSVSRLVAARRQEMAYPARLYSIANFMRYERPQRGREREFWQLNVDVFGVDTLEADVEIITISDTILKRLGGTKDDYTIRINSRPFITMMMAQYLGLDEVQAQQMVKLFDRRRKITDQDFREQAELILGGADDRLEKIEHILTAETIDALPDDLKQSQTLADLRQVFDKLAAAGVESAVFDPTLMRGLDYYTGTVFEVFDTHPDNNRSLFGGGRYDGLVALFGAEPISAVGVAPGGTMIENFLAVRGLMPEYASKVKAYVAVIDGAFDAANALARELRRSGIAVEVDITGRKLDKQIKAASKKGIDLVIFVGPQDTDHFSIKSLSNESEQKLALDDLRRLLA